MVRDEGEGMWGLHSTYMSVHQDHPSGPNLIKAYITEHHAASILVSVLGPDAPLAVQS